MDTFSSDEAEAHVGGRRRRTHSAEFKAQVVAACMPAGVSIAAVAMANGVNANLARRWVQEAGSSGGTALAPGAPAAAPLNFLPVRLQPTEPTSADIRVEVRRAGTTVTVTWPAAAAAECAAWMRELLR